MAGCTASNGRQHVQWLNPGYKDQQSYEDELDLIKFLLNAGATIAKRNGHLPLEARVKEIRQFVFGWASARNLIKIEF